MKRRRKPTLLRSPPMAPMHLKELSSETPTGQAPHQRKQQLRKKRPGTRMEIRAVVKLMGPSSRVPGHVVQ